MHMLLISSALLVIGLYAASYGINKKQLRKNLTFISIYSTIGVVLKSFLTSSLLVLILDLDFKYAWFFGIIMSQIDPIGTWIVNRKKSNRFSQTIKSISIFDDPITAFLLASSFYLFGEAHTDKLLGYGVYLVSNVCVLLAGVILAKHARRKLFIIAGLCTLLVVSTFFQLFIGVALAGLFLRPTFIKAYIRPTVWIVFLVSLLLLISLISIDAASLYTGVILGFIAYFTQIIVGLIFGMFYKPIRAKNLMFVQFNGLTSIILALYLSTQQDLQDYDILTVTALAILTVAFLYVLFNSVIRIFSSRKFTAK